MHAQLTRSVVSCAMRCLVVCVTALRETAVLPSSSRVCVSVVLVAARRAFVAASSRLVSVWACVCVCVCVCSEHTSQGEEDDTLGGRCGPNKHTA